MSGWNATTLGTLINLKRGYDLPSQSRIFGDIPIYSSSGVSGYHRAKMCDGPGVITGRYGTIGQIFFSKSPYWPLNTTLYVQDFRGNDELFVYYFLKLLDWEKYSDKSAVPGVNRNDVHQENVVFPPLPEQKAIAAVLSSLDDKIDLLHRQNTTLEAMAETLFRQWFVVEAKDDWEATTLGDVIEIFDGQRVPLSNVERDKKKDGVLYPYYGAAQIMDYINDYIFDGEYILLGEDGTVRTEEGYPVLQYATGKFWVNNHAHVLRSKEPYSNFFLWNYLSKKNIDEIVTGAVQPKINQGNLKSLGFPHFPENLVNEFNNRTQPILNKIQHNKAHENQLKKLRETLLPKLMSGEVRVRF